MSKQLVYFATYDNATWRSIFPVIKIGITKNLPKRLTELHTASPVKIVVVGTIREENSSRLEKYFHSKFSQARLSGEWFKLSSGMVEAIRQYSIVDDRFDELFDFSEHPLDAKDLEISALRGEVSRLKEKVSTLEQELSSPECCDAIFKRSRSFVLDRSFYKSCKK